VSAQLILALASEDTVVFILDTDLHAANGTRAIIGQLVKDHPELQGRVVVVDLFV
jgi:acetoin utilization deacetylase AcuC-like enzyme